MGGNYLSSTLMPASGTILASFLRRLLCLEGCVMPHVILPLIKMQRRQNKAEYIHIFIYKSLIVDTILTSPRSYQMPMKLHISYATQVWYWSRL